MTSKLRLRKIFDVMVGKSGTYESSLNLEREIPTRSNLLVSAYGTYLLICIFCTEFVKIGHAGEAVKRSKEMGFGPDSFWTLPRLNP